MIERVARGGDGGVEVWARVRGDAAACPDCGRESRRVHSRYYRRLADAAIAGQPARIRLRVRRYFCDHVLCGRRTFVEQVEGLTVRYGRRSLLLRAMLESIALALAGRAGARLARRLAMPVSRSTLLRMIRALPDQLVGEAAAVGVDDFALRRGYVYGTVIIDITTHQPLDVLPERTAAALAAWLRRHPGTRVVCRDRAGAYADAVRTGAPNAVQVADRWHLWHNLAQAVEKTVVAHRGDLVVPVSDLDDGVEQDRDNSEGRPSAPRVETAAAENRLAIRTRERYDAVRELREQGRSISAISRELGLDRKTVKRFIRAADIEQLLVRARSRASLLDAFKPYLHERFNAGHTDAAALTLEIQALGYRGSNQTVRRYLHPFRATLAAPPAVPVPPSVRQVTGWLTRHPDSLTETERLKLKTICDHSEPLATTHQQVTAFADMLTTRRGDKLGDWICEVNTTGSAPLRSFATGLRSDIDAVTNGLTLGYNSGPVEGTVNRIKMIKRQMYGRARFDLLRKRILHPT